MATNGATPSAAGTRADFGPALIAARKAAGLKQYELAAALQLASRTLMRWEGGVAMPRVDVRDTIVGWLRSRTGPEAERALEALGVRFVRANAPTAPLSPEGARAARVAIEHALYRAAEASDVTARAARQIALGVLAAVEAAGVTAAVARGLLATPET